MLPFTGKVSENLYLIMPVRRFDILYNMLALYTVGSFDIVYVNFHA